MEQHWANLHVAASAHSMAWAVHDTHMSLALLKAPVTRGKLEMRYLGTKDIILEILTGFDEGPEISLRCFYQRMYCLNICERLLGSPALQQQLTSSNCHL